MELGGRDAPGPGQGVGSARDANGDEDDDVPEPRDGKGIGMDDEEYLIAPAVPVGGVRVTLLADTDPMMFVEAKTLTLQVSDVYHDLMVSGTLLCGLSVNADEAAPAHYPQLPSQGSRGCRGCEGVLGRRLGHACGPQVD